MNVLWQFLLSAAVDVVVVVTSTVVVVVVGSVTVGSWQLLVSRQLDTPQCTLHSTLGV